jgi:ribonuclease R
MQELGQRMRKARLARGALDLDLPEAVVLLDEDDPKRVRDVKRARALPEVREAYRLVEEFMLAANFAVAHFFAERQRDTIWRIHATPAEARLEEFATLAKSLGIPFDAEAMRNPKALREFLEKLTGSKLERALSFLLLRAMKQAAYDVENHGHFGLAAPEYLHFTSPIRRYPDLIVHRLLKQELHQDGLPSGGGFRDPAPSREELVQQAAACSGYERRAMEAEREVVDMYRAFLMRDQIGEEFDGTISGVTSFGLFIEIAEPFVEGLIKTEKLGRERFQFDERTLRLSGERSGRAFTLGDSVRVRVENVSVPRRHLDLALIEDAGQAETVKSSERPRKRRRS